MRNQFTFYASYLEAAENLPQKLQGEVILAIVKYAIRQEMPGNLSGVSKAIFLMAKPTLDSGRKKAEQRERAICNNKDVDSVQHTVADSGNNKDDTSGRNEYKKEVECKKEIEIECKSKVEKESYITPYSPPRGTGRLPAPRFVPPSVDDVRAYCEQRRNGVDPESFVNFYASKGWKVGSSPMKDWKAAVRTWEQRDGRGPGTADKPKTNNPFLAMALEMEDDA